MIRISELRLDALEVPHIVGHDPGGLSTYGNLEDHLIAWVTEERTPQEVDLPEVRHLTQVVEDRLDQAHVLENLKVPPGDRLEARKGDRKGQHSIRINDQFRICLRRTDAGPADVEIVDYHG
jgi:plasmid maintenance system killer protein